MFVFFFQAEDGIRDRNVTGVQTCALPIWGRIGGGGQVVGSSAREGVGASPVVDLRTVGKTSGCRCDPRSEERRVGKECRSRRAPEHDRKKECNSEWVKTTLRRARRRRHSE